MSYNLYPTYQPFSNYISYVAELVADTVYIPDTSTPATTYPDLILYVNSLLGELRVSKITSIIALIYCDHLRCRLPINACGASDTLYRVFTASLLVACKYMGEKYTNKDFAEASGIFTLQEINQIERELLILLDYNIWISSDMVRDFYFSNKAGLESENSRSNHPQVYHVNKDGFVFN
ncbi:PHO85 cyclin-1 [Entomophthora muscae]|uniref:PHO85 cyclin-1 n=1 Tax=Entomophthora muscae TaxID=34485 RepID=A0ACC2RF81_9FUNG|nr:PHO85 cyclin-1 [Entomophthora muscae]